MTMYAPADIRCISVGPDHQGCGNPHARGTDPVTGTPEHPWGVTCDQCEQFLRMDGRWSATVDDIPETFDEKRARERFELKGTKVKDGLLAIAMAKMAGISAAEIPPELSKMLGSGLHIPGVTVCPAGHDNTPGARFCSMCGSAMSGPAAAAALPPGNSE